MDLQHLAQQTLRKTWNIHQPLYRHLEASVESVAQRFDPKKYDPWYFTHSVRYEVCQRIDSAESAAQFKRVPLPMSGLEFAGDEFRLKVWKANGGELPIAGNSPGRSSFLSQPFLTNYLESLNSKAFEQLRLVVSWDVDSRLHLFNVRLVCPKDFESPWKVGNEHFSIEIPHPASEIASPTQFTEEASELEIQIERKKAGTRDNSGD
jgi:hypothetical protein